MVSVKLRAWQNSDLEGLVKYANNRNISRNLTDQFPFPYTKEKGEEFIAYARGKGPNHIFAIDLEGQAIGGIGIHPQADIFRKNAELGYWLAEEYWGRGITTEAIRLVIDYAFENLDVDRVFARPFGSNIPSQRVLEKNGFVLEARFEKTIIKGDEYQDELVYALRRKRWEKRR